jgi:hypothetical protein
MFLRNVVKYYTRLYHVTSSRTVFTPSSRSYDLKKEASSHSDVLVPTKRCQIPDDSDHYRHGRENFDFQIYVIGSNVLFVIFIDY